MTAPHDNRPQSRQMSADFILHGFRLVGVHSVTIGLTLAVVAATGLRRSERWAWWVLLAPRRRIAGIGTAGR